MIKDILVCTNDISNRSNTVQTAAKFATENDARLTGLYIKADLVRQYHAYGTFSVMLMEQLLEQEKEDAIKAEGKFHNIAHEMGCNARWLCIDESEDPVKDMYYTDLIFMSYSNPKNKNKFNGTGFINHLLLDSGRPVVVIPENWTPSTLGKQTLFGWNESKESARALHETLPLLQKAEHVNVVTVAYRNDDSESLAQGIEINHYLTHRNVNCQLYTEKANPNPQDIGNALLAHAHQSDTDLIIIGGYGHSRLHEMLLGGVTRHLIHNTQVPLLLVH